MLRHRVLAFAALGAALASLPRAAAAEECPPGVRETQAPLVISDWKPGDAVPCGYKLRSKHGINFILAGSLVFALTHLPAVAAGAFAAKGDPPSIVAAVPVVGPLIALTRVDPAWRSYDAAFAAIDAAGQAVGLGMLIAGAATRTYTLVRNDLVSAHIVPIPMALGRAGAGLGLAGMF
jgi:hypothetical protein